MDLRNAKMEELMSKLGIKNNFGLVYLPQSNGRNERNHCSYDVIVSKVKKEDKTFNLKEAVNKASWMLNFNFNVLGYLLL